MMSNFLPTLAPYLIGFFVLAGLAAALVVGVGATFLVRNHALRTQLCLPIGAYYRALVRGHDVRRYSPAH